MTEIEKTELEKKMTENEKNYIEKQIGDITAKLLKLERNNQQFWDAFKRLVPDVAIQMLVENIESSAIDLMSYHRDLAELEDKMTIEEKAEK